MNPLLSTIVVPALVAGTLWLLAWALDRRKAPESIRNATAWLAVPAAVITAYVLILGLPSIPPGRSTEWLPWVTLTGGLAGALGTLALQRAWVVCPVQIVAAAGAATLPLLSLYQNTWSTTAGIGWGVAMAVALLVACLVNQRTATNLDPRGFGLLAWLVAAATAVSLGLSGSGLLAQLSGVLAACAGAMVVMGFIAPARKVDAGTIGALTLLHGVVVLQGHHYAELPLPAAIALLAALPLAGVMPTRALAARPVWQRAALRGALVLLPLAISVAQAFYLWKAAQESGAGYY